MQSDCNKIQFEYQEEFDTVRTIDTLNLRVKLNLQFFEGEKTEEATSKKRTEARKEGQVAKSQEIGTAFLFLTSFFVLKMTAGYIAVNLQNIITDTFQLIKDYDQFMVENPGDKLISQMFALYAVRVSLIIGPLLLAIMAVGIVTNVMQVGWKPTSKVLQPKFSKLNPLKGFKRMFSLMSVVELLKSLLKLGIIGAIVYSTLADEILIIPQTPFYSLTESIIYYANVAYDLGITVGFAYLGIAIFDYVFQKWKHNKDLKMSKQEVKDEYKQTEGNPEIKGKIRQKMREASMRRMMQDIPSADVIITNPTHFAVAIRYKHNQDIAPTVVAKGADHLAKRIREAAKENDIEIVENKPLARSLYASVEVGEQIPPELYQSVAEILAFVYKLKNKI